ncbi:MAG: PH domain-containing protein [Sphingomonadales bacterium]|nr:PH domain-containing protein [Sphingomonadales bacterium]MBK9002639.1 PH domain-containing protein [Sphingomonadales bacterium]MBK9267860.1 PH domain-containing protein [Sphingomonadales bacterium]MBP6433901.1 PH domain-containing protein [Sphingorhabdus sp.]
MSEVDVLPQPLPQAEGQQQGGQRLHPLGLFVSFISGLPQLFLPIVAVLFGSGSRNRPELIPLVILGVLFVSLFFRWLGWMRFQYHLGEDDIRIERGILSRSARSIPYDRIQDVSIEQKPLPRLLGLGEVKFETGGGDGEDAKLSYVSLSEAERLRETIKARKAGQAATTGETAAVEEESGATVFAMDTGRLLTLGLYSFSLVIFAVLGGVAQQFDFLLSYDIWDIGAWIGVAEDNGVSIETIGTGARIIGALAALAGLVAIGILTGIIRTFLTDYGFRLERTAKGFRRRRGLLTLTDVVMPVARVQAAIVETGPVRKRRGWHALRFVSLAQESKQESHHMVAPLARLDEIWPIVAEAGIAQPGETAALQHGKFGWWLSGFVIVLPIIFIAMAALMLFAEASLARASLLLLLLPLMLAIMTIEWRVYRHGEDGMQLYVRRGWWRQRLTILPQVRVQSVEIAQSPLARLVGLVSLRFGVAGGKFEMLALPREAAEAIRDNVLAIAAPVDFSVINRRG